ncbi:MAG TPA: hypothetical protein DEH02_08670 [Bacteroidales bacterium]|nr:MAG: hypothetical protein A2X01_03400 [Bacteroidetes bacterium GWF2_35_48]HBX51123.1 hypothetical protein [Bacteroidales bacterium]
MAKQWLYSLLLKDSLLAFSSPVFETFIDSITGSNTGTIYSINQTLSDTTGLIDTLAVANANMNITPQNIIETNYKTVINIYQSILSQGINCLTQNQIETLESIAILCPYTDGNAVYSARAILSLISSDMLYKNECEMSKPDNFAEAKIVNQTTSSPLAENNLVKETASVYPNPAKDVINISYSLINNGYFELYDLLGKKISTEVLNLSKSSMVVSLTKLQNGIYYYKITSGNEVITTSKLLIVK